MSEEKGKGLLFVLLGCAGVCLLGLCGATGVAAYLVMRDGGESLVGAPDLGTDPGTKPPSPGPDDAPGAPPVPSMPRVRVGASVTHATSGVVPSGASCLFDVEPPADARSMCRAQIVCGGQLLYGGQRAGFFPCAVTPGTPPTIAGRDDQTTGSDGDGAMAIDTGALRLTVRDDAEGPHGAFALEARIESVE